LPFPILDPVIKYKSFLVKIRCNTDKGIIAILDSRIGDSSKSLYKNQVFDCIKSVNRTTDLNV